MHRVLSGLSLLALVIFLGVSSPLAVGPDSLWMRTFGGGGMDVAYSVKETFDGGYVIAGRGSGIGYGDVYLIKTDGTGDAVWKKIYGAKGPDRAFSIQQTSDGGYIVAGYTSEYYYSTSDVYLIRVDADGDTLWTKTYGGLGTDMGKAVQQVSDGGFIIAGATDSFGAGETDVYLIRTNASGDTLWTRTYGGTDHDGGSSVQQTSDGGFAIAGYSIPYDGASADFYLIKTDALGHTLWTRAYDGGTVAHSVRQTWPDGGYLMVGAGTGGIYAVKTDPLGDTLWTRSYGSYEGWSVDQTSDGGYIIGGTCYTSGTDGNDVYLVKTDADGDTVWTRAFGGSDDDFGYSVQQTSDGGYIIGGATESFGVGLLDVFLIKTVPDFAGTHRTEDIKRVSLSVSSTPNPSSAGVIIRYSAPNSQHVRLMIANLLGQEIRTLVDADAVGGALSVRWDGTDRHGIAVGPGIYLCSIQCGRKAAACKIVRIR